MKQIVIGDTHGRTDWKEISNQQFDRFIFIGDYVDTHEKVTGEQQLENLLDIIKFKKDNPDRVVLLIGNHDYHYMKNNTNDTYSGFQHDMNYTFNHIFELNKDLFQMCFLDENNNIFSHAGISESWLQLVQITSKDLKVICDSVNNLFKTNPEYFGFYEKDWTGYGGNVNQGPIWIRLAQLYSDTIPNCTQIVGHSTQKEINKFGNIIPIDVLPTSKEYLIIQDGIITTNNNKIIEDVI